MLKLSVYLAVKQALLAKVFKTLSSVLTKADRWLIGSLLAASIVGIGWQLLLPATQHQLAEIRSNGKVLQSVILKAGYYQEVIVQSGASHNIIEVRDGRIRMKAANCPDQDCIHTGWLERPPRQIVCLPNRISISVIASAALDIDDIVR